jgi:uncharacterized membrane protein
VTETASPQDWQLSAEFGYEPPFGLAVSRSSVPRETFHPIAATDLSSAEYSWSELIAKRAVAKHLPEAKFLPGWNQEGPIFVWLVTSMTRERPMNYIHTVTDRPRAADSVHAFLQSFPIACFTLTVFTDVAYMQTLNLLFLHFSEWLLLAGIVFGSLGLLARLVEYLVRRRRPPWPAILGGVIVLLLAVINSFIHTADGWTAVMPYGLTLSILTVLAMIVTGWFAIRSVRHV